MITYTLDKVKYKAALLYVANALGKIEGMKKAYKLFYFLDFDFFEAYDRPFTGETYKSLQMGPVPIYFTSIVKELINEKSIRIEKKKISPAYENDATIYVPVKHSSYKFSKEEKHMLDRIIKQYGGMTGKDLEKLSHTEVPYNAVEVGEIIPYEYSIYRDTPNLTS